MSNFRIYGPAPYRVAVIHGGPGAAGEMAPVARQLATKRSVLEPLQTAGTVEGQVTELKTVLENSAAFPLTLIGYSWGAWLVFILAAQYPALVKKLLLVSSGPFEEKYAAGIMETRLNRLSIQDRTKVTDILKECEGINTENKNSLLQQLGNLLSRADAHDPIETALEPADKIDYRIDIFQKVWKTASELRKNGKLLDYGRQILCPVVALHGYYDPHPFEGVEKPLSKILTDFRFILLKNCGHKPWTERKARTIFFNILDEEIS